MADLVFSLFGLCVHSTSALLENLQTKEVGLKSLKSFQNVESQFIDFRGKKCVYKMYEKIREMR